MSDGYKQWYIDKEIGLIICNKCYSKTYNRRHIFFKGRKIVVESCPRSGRCSKCGRQIGVDDIKITNMHHDKYHDDNPLKDTRELCASCHRKEHVLIYE
jgi:hypothetical protein